VIRVLVDGTILLDPPEALALAALAREGARQLAARRRLTPAEAEALSAVELAAYSARRSAAGPAAVPTAPPPASSGVTVAEAAGALKVSQRHVRRLIRSGHLVADRHGPVWCIDPDSLAGHALARKAAA
jgi:excisionase family DNA binding protein